MQSFRVLSAVGTLVLAVALTVTFAASGHAATAVVSLSTGSASYTQGETVSINGRVLLGGSPVVGTAVALEAEGQQSGHVYWIDQVTTQGNGTFSDSFAMPQAVANDAEMVIWASADGGHGQAVVDLQPVTPISPGSGGSGGSGGGGSGGGSGSGSTGLPPQVDQTISTTGGSVATSDGSAKVSVPSGALTSSTTVSISEEQATTATAPLTADLSAASPVVTLDFGGVTLAKPLLATFKYALPSAQSIAAARIGLFYDDTWHWVKSTVDPQSGIVTADVSQPGQYVVLVNSTTFNDIPSNYSASSQLDTLLGRAAVSGFPDGGFHPTAQVSRAQFVKMLVLALGLNVPTKATSDGFKDVPANSWYAAYVDAAVQAKLVQGLAAAKFAPGASITREQLAVMVARAMNGYTPRSPLQVRFKDQGRIGGWALPAVMQAAQAGIVKGLPDGAFAPLTVATRTDAVTWLGNLVTITNQ